MLDEISAIHLAIALLSGLRASQDNKFNFIIIIYYCNLPALRYRLDYTYIIIYFNAYNFRCMVSSVSTKIAKKDRVYEFQQNLLLSLEALRSNWL